MKMEAVNQMDREAFVSAFGFVFEHSPWVAERAWERRPFASPDFLHRAMADAVAAAETGEQLALLRAHPDLGTKARMSAASEGEQAGAGLDRLTPAEFEHLRRLNDAYRAKFGFPFIYAVRNSGKQQILEALENRLAGTAEAERVTALEQVNRIAQFRLENLFSCTDS